MIINDTNEESGVSTQFQSWEKQVSRGFIVLRVKLHRQTTRIITYAESVGELCVGSAFFKYQLY